MDETFLLDTNVAHVTDEQLLRFDTLPETGNDNLCYNKKFVLEWDTNRVGMYGVKLEGKRDDLSPRAGQLMYALYQLHCKWSLAMCI
jgi:hypothetical protein